MNSEVTKIELAKALKSIKDVSSPEQFKRIKDIFLTEDTQHELMSSVNGLSEEDEFAMLTKLMGTATHIIGLEQRPLIKGEYIIPDFLINFKIALELSAGSANGLVECKRLVEVKSTIAQKFKIGGSKLQRLRNTADLMGFPLLFAVRFLQPKQHAMWAIVEDKRKSTSLHITHDDIVDGVRDVFWNEYLITPNPNLLIRCEYSKSSTSNGVPDREYGRQVSITFTDGINSLKLEDPEAFLTMMIFEAFAPVRHEVINIDSDRNIEVLKLSLFSAFLSDLVYRANRLVVDEFGNIEYDASKLVVRSDTDAHDKLLSKQIIEFLVKPLVDKDLLFIGSMRKEKHQLGK